MHLVSDPQVETEQEHPSSSSTLPVSQSLNNQSEAGEGRAERSPSSCFYSLSQDLIAIQLTTRHAGAVLIASRRSEWATAYGGESGERRDDGKPSGLVRESCSTASICDTAPFSLGGPCRPGFSGCKHALVMGTGGKKKNILKHQRPFLWPKIG